MPPQKRLSKAQDLRFQQELGQLVRELRKPSSNQDDFADQVGLYRSHMGLIEQGKLDLRLSTLLALADALKLSLSDLLRQVEERLSSNLSAAGDVTEQLSGAKRHHEDEANTPSS